MKVIVYAISKNESQFVNRWVDSMSEADAIHVTDTGSTDDTVQLLEARGVFVHHAKIDPWRFDEARNQSLANVPKDADICICTDLDEVFEPGWRQHLETAWKEAEGIYKQANYTYNWSHNADGSPGVQFTYSKIHSREGFTWNYPCHEWLGFIGEGSATQISLPDVVLNHYPDPNKSRADYLPLLEMAVKEDPGSSRMLFYLGREYKFNGRWEESIQIFKAYLNQPLSYWSEERACAMRWIAFGYLQLNQHDTATVWFTRAIAEAPHMREPYVDYARYAYTQENWPLQYYLLEEALKIEKRSDTFVNQAYCWDETPYDLQAIAAYNLGLYQRSLDCAIAAFELKPDDDRLADNVVMISEALQKQEEAAGKSG